MSHKCMSMKCGVEFKLPYRNFKRWPCEIHTWKRQSKLDQSLSNSQDHPFLDYADHLSLRNISPPET